jgi:hypothetical protein
LDGDLQWLVAFCRSFHIALSSKKTYLGLHKIFLSFCETFFIDPFSITEAELCKCVAYYTLTHTVNTVDQYLSAIQKLWDEAGAGPLPRDRSFKICVRGLKRLLDGPDEVRRTSAIGLLELGRMVGSLSWDSPTDVTLGCMLIVGFFLALRTEDLADGRLTWGCIYPQANGDCFFSLPPGKSVRRHRRAGIAARTDVLSFLPWLDRLSSFLPESAKRPHSPLFPSFDAASHSTSTRASFAAVSRSRFTAQLKALVRVSLQVSPVYFSGYSLRRGGVTAMLMAGISPAILKSHVGWSPASEAFNLYYDHSGLAQQLIPTLALRAVVPRP